MTGTVLLYDTIDKSVVWYKNKFLCKGYRENSKGQAVKRNPN